VNIVINLGNVESQYLLTRSCKTLCFVYRSSP